jgi:hypothetical protein
MFVFFLPTPGLKEFWINQPVKVMNVACPALAGPNPRFGSTLHSSWNRKKGQDQVTYTGGVPATVSAFVQTLPFYVWKADLGCPLARQH